MKKLCKIIAITIQKKNPEINGLIELNTGQYRVVDEVLVNLHKAFGGTLDNGEYKQLLLLSDEKIKENDWYYSQAINGIYKATVFPLSCKDSIKIITTYPKLDNLPTFQSVFIQEWCENPIEEIEVQYDSWQEYKGSKPYIKEKLILTQNNEIICNIPNRPYAEMKAYGITNACWDESQIIAKQHDDSIEFAAEGYYEENKIDIRIAPRNGLLQTTIERAFITGANWQREKNYTEEEVSELIKTCWNIAFQYGVNENYCHSNKNLANCNSWKTWFEQNKKK